jgi:hypothetical protein
MRTRRSLLALLAGLLIVPVLDAEPARADSDVITITSECQLYASGDDPSLDSPQLEQTAARWAATKDDGSIDIISASVGTIDRSLGYPYVRATAAGTSATFDQTLVVEVDGERRTLHMPIYSDCRSLPDAVPSTSGATRVHNIDWLCYPDNPLFGAFEPEVFLGLAYKAAGYTAIAIDADVDGYLSSESFFNGSARTSTLMAGTGPTMVVPVTAQVTFQPDGGGPNLVETYDFDLDVTCSVLADQGLFSDDNDSVFEADIEWLATEGITQGCNPPANTRFCPDDPVTRGQMAAFLVRALAYTDRGTVDFTDDNGSVFEADIERLATEGITFGCNPPANTRFCPDDPVTRGQMAAFLKRALDR